MIELFQVKIVYLPFTYPCCFKHLERKKLENIPLVSIVLLREIKIPCYKEPTLTL